MTVIVVGAGPTGLMLAGDLAEAGIEVRILEKRAEESNLTRAFAVHARTLEQLDARGLADELVEQGFPVKGVDVTFGERGIHLSMEHPESRFPYVLMVQQARTEALLQSRVERLGVPVVRGAEVTGLAQDADGVTLTVRTAEGEHTERATYAVGTDGAHSTVRELLGVRFSGHSYNTHIILADVRLEDELPPRVNPFIGDDGIALLPPYGDGWFRATVWDRARQDTPLTEPVTFDELAESLQRLSGGRLRLAETRWSTRFLSERRQARHYRVGRVFLAGDAAHVHSPMGAMGMSTGIQDAANLSWKLAAAVRGRAPEWLLDSYESERHPVGRATLRLSDVILRMAVAPAAVRAIRPYVAPALMGVERVARRVRLLMSGLGYSYTPPAAVTPSEATGERVGDVALTVDGTDTRLYELMDGVRFLLVDTSPEGAAADAAAPWADRIRVVRARGDLPGGATALLVRPDAYTAWDARPGQDDLGERVRGALAQWAGPVGART
ncbi:2-polyprenyl-6-methoxyphenol hydroxylase-like FAD-dependent oxidoreductase [Nocardiopsis sp. Huas11]|uniref:FAD-dependent monooxygenase n=1 Tax=Nocardiopsis sp. Huas11 TaxID=2183912 RepID=UPI000EAD0AD3|nr:FAD-dependent monooxygenase [Nocardiopsis sp. Huas11]RKS04713.1 2-polyprenyl-6-methoxyphenol hydroxylase-like FAD-dependent oxidoreductase [Nocardiopsis sp. Huas11]